MKAWMSSNFGQIPPPTPELPRPRYQVSVYRTIGPLVESIILILAGNEDMHESLDEFKFWADTTTNSRVTLAHLKN